jgi:uncharacterized lipoprotein YmbA
MMKFRFATIALMLVLSSCASTPDLDYYTLDMSPSGAVTTDLNLEVARFAISERIDRTQIVIQKSPTRIDYYSKDRWASSLGEMVEHKLAIEFGSAMDGRRTLIVSGRVVALEQVDSPSGPQALARLEVEVRDGGAKGYETPLLVKIYEIEKSASDNSVDALIQALSRAVEEIAAQITADAAGL